MTDRRGGLERADGTASAAAVRSLAEQVGVDPMLVAQHLRNGTAAMLLGRRASVRRAIERQRALLRRRYSPAD